MKEVGFRPPYEACVKGGLATKGLKTGPNKSRGVPKTPEHRAAISASVIGKPKSHRGKPWSAARRAAEDARRAASDSTVGAAQ
jgi:hypothetical protein